MPAGMRKLVQPIPGTPLPHGILNTCATVEDVQDVHELMGVEWMALGCCPVQEWQDPCLTDESAGEESPGERPEKQFCRPSVEHASPITLYAGAECSSIGWSYEEAVAHATATMELGEQHGLEAAFWSRLTADAVDLTPPAGPVSVAQGVAALEGALAEGYGGVGVLHVPAGLAALLGCCRILTEDPSTGALLTLAGNCAIIGAGYSTLNTGPGGIPADPGTAWMYVTGPVHIRRGPMDVIPDRSASLNIRTNDRRVLVERTYVVGTTCTVAAINVEACA
ncbi:cupin [Streptomyces fuscigenes]|uniref:cupin n=1 Tax=Streptomyces fuscigenes TaxID=1528880 RepID=UPI001F29DB7C|nr:cupin [Streptomyces fuscigenes]MCF3960621.1 cupin [Streptomyces fuscigenes]